MRSSRRVTVEGVLAACRRIGISDHSLDRVVAEVSAKPGVRSPAEYLAQTLVEHVEHWLRLSGIPPEFDRARIRAAIGGCEATLGDIADAFERCGVTMGQVAPRRAAATSPPAATVRHHLRPQLQVVA